MTRTLFALLALAVSGCASAQAPAPEAPALPASGGWADDPLRAVAEAVPTPEPLTASGAMQQRGAAWQTVAPAILEHIQTPRIPDRTCAITDHGAVSGDGADDLPAILAAIEACAEAGGGRVLVPEGEWLARGPVHLRSRIDLHLASGATLRFSADPDDYPLVLTRWEGTFLFNYSPLVYARGLEDVAITGAGTLDGQAAEGWAEWKQLQEPAKDRLRQMGIDRVPVEDRVFGDGWYLRPSLVQFFDCDRVLIEGVTLRESPFWTTHLVLNEHVTVRGVTIRPGTTNDDGIDPDGSRFVLIEDNDIWTYDDAIALKAGRDADGRASRPTQYVVIQRNRLRSSVGGAMSVGSEMSGGVEWVFVRDVVAENDGGHGLYIKSNRDRGGFVRHLYLRDIDVLDAADGFLITTDYKGFRGTDHPPEVHDVHLDGVRVWFAREVSVRLLGQPDNPVRRVSLADVQIRGEVAWPVFREASGVIADSVSVGGRPFRAEDAASADGQPGPRY
ncbi:MAG: glycoside hydrolase family 28 protein [Bacteroidota bacterium]